MDITIGELRRAAAKSVPGAIIIDLMLLDASPNRYKKFVSLVERAVCWISRDMSRNPELSQGQTEDQLNIQFIRMLRSMTFAASHGTKVGGHCDIIIDGPEDSLWFGEAKKYRGNNWLWKGFQQLTTRYATAQTRQTAGGLIVYCFDPRADLVMERWKTDLASRADPVSTRRHKAVPLSFRSSHRHDRTGMKLDVLHVPVPLYFSPRDHFKIKDRSRRRGKSPG